ncbi:MAG: helix-turn-helix transcriptional regulator [Verrucomicrobiaceae bacterium]|nr:helix-turn-helix transcriptional regulator [Verrucomicrobiaceae bacterium]
MKVSSPQDLGILIREERKKRGWTQAELADRVGVRPLWISEFERGKTMARIGLVFQTIKALGLSISVDKVEHPSGVEKGLDLNALVQTMRKEPDKITVQSSGTVDDAGKKNDE